MNYGFIFEGLIQKRRNSIAFAMELRLFYIKPSYWEYFWKKKINLFRAETVLYKLPCHVWNIYIHNPHASFICQNSAASSSDI